MVFGEGEENVDEEKEKKEKVGGIFRYTGRNLAYSFGCNMWLIVKDSLMLKIMAVH